MKKVLLAMALVLGTVSANAATASTTPSSWNCSFGFTGQSTAIKVIVGFYRFAGQGRLQCISDSGETANYPVTVRMNALPVSPAISLGVMNVNAKALDFRLVGHSPLEVMGTYSILQSQVALVGGLGAVTAIHESQPFAMKLALQFASGLGLNVGMNKLHIELDNSRM